MKRRKSTKQLCRWLHRKSLPLCLERLEDRLLMSSGPDPIGRILPLYPPGTSPYEASDADLPTAEATGLYSMILGRTPDTSGLQGWTSFLQGGARPADVVQDFLNSPEYQALLVENYYRNFLNRSANQVAINS